MKTKDEDFAVSLRRVRDENGWSMEELARRMGVSLQTIYRWEKRMNKPSPLAKEKFKAICLS